MKRMTLLLISLLLVFVIWFYPVNAAQRDIPIWENGMVIKNEEIIVGHRGDYFQVYESESGGRLYRFSKDYEKWDEITAGDINGDGKDEIVHGDRSSDDIYVFNMEGRELAKRDVNFEAGDDLATGDVDGDGKDEVIFADRSSDWINALNENLDTEKRFRVDDFSDEDGIGAGDFDGNGVDEVVHGDHSENIITVYTMNGDILWRFSTLDYFDLSDRDEIAAGDVNLDGVDELIVATQDKDNDGRAMGIHIFALSKGGSEFHEIAYFPIFFRGGDRIAVGDVNSDGVNEIVWASQNGDVKTYNMQGDVLGSFNAEFQYGAGLAVGDVDGNSIKVGPPRKGEMAVERKIIAVINAPPTDFDVINEDGIFYAKYTSIETEAVETVVKAITDVKLSFGVRNSVGMSGIASIETNLRTSVGWRNQREMGESFETKTTLTLKTDRADGAVRVTTYYDVYEFPIISPPELAVVDGKQQYILVTIPKGPPEVSFGPYDSPIHVVGDINTYPTSVYELKNYDASNELATFTIEVADVQASYERAMKTMNWKRGTNSFSVGVSVSTKASGTIVPGVTLGFSFQGDYGNEKIKTHEVKFSEETKVLVEYRGRVDEEDKRYNATGVIYFDSKDGHLVLDFYVPSKGDYYRSRTLSSITVTRYIYDIRHHLLLPIQVNLMELLTNNTPPTCSLSAIPLEGKEPLDVEFQLEFDDPNNDTVHWEMDFGDGAFMEGNGTEVSHSYTEEGTYVATLSVYDEWNSKSTCDVSLRVLHNDEPRASFAYSPSEVKAGEPVGFRDSSNDPDGSVVAWLWDFGDGSTSTEKNPSHSYDSPGTYTVVLTVTDDRGMKGSHSETVLVLPANMPPTADFTIFPKTPKAGEEVSFVDKSHDSDGNIGSWQWDFGDGSTSTEREPSHVFEKPGNYTVTLTVRDDGGGADSKRMSVVVAEAPTETPSETETMSSEKTETSETSATKESQIPSEGTCGPALIVLLALLARATKRRK